MPRRPRTDEPGLCYHVTARGIEKRQIYCDDRDRRFFLAKLGELARDTGTQVFAFALIPNHFHLLIRRNSVPVSVFMQRLLTSYALFFNKRHKRSGHLFQNRYKSFPCTNTAYFLQLVRYISLNPVRAGLVGTMEKLEWYPYSSHKYLLRPNQNSWLEAQFVLAHFGNDEQSARKAYLQFVTNGPGEEGEGCPNKEDKPLPVACTPKRALAVDMPGDQDSLIEEICTMYSLSRAELMGSTKRKDIAKARALLAYRMAKEIGLSGSEIGRRLSVTRSAVSKMINRERDLMGRS